MGGGLMSSGGGRIPAPHGVGRDPTVRKRSQFLGFPPPNGQPIVCANIYFEFNKADLGHNEWAALDSVADVLTLFTAWEENFSCTCFGYADIRGQYGHNVNISAERAAAVKNYLRKKVPDLPFEINSSPFDASFSPHHEPESWAEDRRVDVKIKSSLLKSGIGFEFNEVGHADIFVKDLERAEIQNGGDVKAWMKAELLSIKHEHEFAERYGWKSAKPITSIIARMEVDSFIELSHSHTAACIEVKWTAPRPEWHRVTARVWDAEKLVLLFPEVTVEGSSHTAIGSELYSKLCGKSSNITKRVKDRR
jgi:outer membrane protein OmpA-like peptidoglycan-associated protein